MGVEWGGGGAWFHTRPAAHRCDRQVGLRLQWQWRSLFAWVQAAPPRTQVLRAGDLVWSFQGQVLDYDPHPQRWASFIA